MSLRATIVRVRFAPKVGIAMPVFKAWINPLKCPEIDLDPLNGANPTTE